MSEQLNFEQMIEESMKNINVKEKIEGTIITAEGAGDANVKENIIQAVSAATGLASHKIQVFQMSK